MKISTTEVCTRIMNLRKRQQFHLDKTSIFISRRGNFLISQL